MIYSGDKIKPFVFIHLAKCGGSSVTKTLANYIGEPRENYRNGKKKFIKATAIDYLILNSSEYFIFSIIRNPFDRVVSFYNYKQQIRQPPHNLSKDITFDKWINMKGYHEIPHMHTQLCFNKNNGPPIKLKIHPVVNFVGRLENIEEDWSIICKNLNIEIELIHDKKSEHKSYQEYYNAETREIIENYFKTDLKLFNYQF